MKDYSYFIPGYTGFCPELKEHFGQTYGYATRHIIGKNPNLKERLAPVHYRYRRYERAKGPLKKIVDPEENTYDYIKSKIPTEVFEACKTKYRTKRDAGVASKRIYHPDYEYGDIKREKCYGDYGRVDPCMKKFTSIYADGDKIRNGIHESIPPEYVFIEGFSERVYPNLWTHKKMENLQEERYPCVAIPCVHVMEYSRRLIPAEKIPDSTPYVHLKKYYPEDCGQEKNVKLRADPKVRRMQHVLPQRQGRVLPEDCGHEKDAKFCGNHKLKKIQRVVPHRQGGVIPKYTGHVPGMVFSFGESYGPISDRLLRKHHDRMKELKIKT